MAPGYVILGRRIAMTETVGAHLRARFYQFANVAVFLTLAVATLTANLIHLTG
jgi:hypothetical protein